MRTYKEYYKFGLEHFLDWKSKQTEEWWKNKDEFGYLETKGDYIETTKFLTVDEKNDSSLFTNTTNVRNSEWDILFSMLGQALVDWIIENMDYKNVWSFNLKIRRVVDNGINLYVPDFSVTNYQGRDGKDPIVDETDTDKLDKYKECSNFLCDIVNEFIEEHSIDIPNDWNYFGFGLDSLCESCKYGEWICASDGYMNLMNYNDETTEYDMFVECM